MALLTTLLILFSIPAYPALGIQTPHSDPSQISIDHLEDDTLVFQIPEGMRPFKPLKSGIYDLSHLGTLYPSEGGYPYFLLSGKPCKNCLDDKAIYALRPSGGKPTAFVYPGKILDPKDRSLLFEARAFYGKCLPHRGEVLVIFQKEKTKKKKMLEPSVLIAEAKKDYFDELFLERRLPSIQNTLQFVKRKTCREIEGRNRLMLSKPLDLHPHNDSTNDDNDEDGDQKQETSSIDD